MTPAVRVDHVSRRYHGVTAVDEASFALEEGRIHGLLGRNGAGKTTLMRLVTGLDRPTSGTVEVFGSDPFENEAVLRRTCFVKESQTYPDLSVTRVLASARLLQPAWDENLARSLVADFDLPLGRRVRKLSRGMRSALGIVIGLASRAPAHPLRRALPRARRPQPGPLLRPAARRLRRAPAHRGAVDPPHRRGRQPARARRGRRPRPGRHRCRGRRGSRNGLHGRRAGRAGRRVRQPARGRGTPGRRGLRLGHGARPPRRPERRLADELRLDLSPVSLQELVAHATHRGPDDTPTPEGGTR